MNAEDRRKKRRRKTTTTTTTTGMAKGRAIATETAITTERVTMMAMTTTPPTTMKSIRTWGAESAGRGAGSWEGTAAMTASDAP